MSSYYKKTPDELRQIMDSSPPDTPTYIKARDALVGRGEPLKAYVFQPYPKVLYHWKHGSRTVQTEAEEYGLVQEDKWWVTSPAQNWKPVKLFHQVHKTDGYVFESPEEEAEATSNGWVTSPAKFSAVPPVSSMVERSSVLDLQKEMPLTDEQWELLELLATLYRSGRRGEFFIIRTLDGSSSLIFADQGPSVDITYDDTDFRVLNDEGLIHLQLDFKGNSKGKITGRGLEVAEQRARPKQNEEPKPGVTMDKRAVFVIHGRNDFATLIWPHLIV